MSRMLYGIENGSLCYLVKYDTTGVCFVQSQHFAQVPANRFSFTVLIGSQPHFLGSFHVLFEFTYQFLFLFRYLIVRLHGLLVHTQCSLFEVSDMSEA